ncbi:MAG: NRDE family protein, partial [Halobacteriota archaeon]
GTWVGVNDSGLLAGVANLPVAADGDSRSRGLLCLDVLGCRSVDAARRLVEREVDRRRYDGFNLVVGGSDGGFVASFDVSGLSVFEVEGAGVVTNSGFDDPDGKARRVAEALPDAASADDWLDGVRPLMSDHDLGVCVHGDDRGTTSSTLVRGGTDPAVWFASGPPCEADYVSCV